MPMHFLRWCGFSYLVLVWMFSSQIWCNVATATGDWEQHACILLESGRDYL